MTNMSFKFENYCMKMVDIELHDYTSYLPRGITNSFKTYVITDIEDDRVLPNLFTSFNFKIIKYYDFDPTIL